MRTLAGLYEAVAPVTHPLVCEATGELAEAYCAKGDWGRAALVQESASAAWTNADRAAFFEAATRHPAYIDGVSRRARICEALGAHQAGGAEPQVGRTGARGGWSTSVLGRAKKYGRG